jgi:hypothetical protein
MDQTGHKRGQRVRSGRRSLALNCAGPWQLACAVPQRHQKRRAFLVSPL